MDKRRGGDDKRPLTLGFDVAGVVMIGASPAANRFFGARPSN